VAETPLHRSPQARVPFRPIEKDHSNVAGQASGFRGGNAYPHTSQRVFVGAETITIKILFGQFDFNCFTGFTAAHAD
jgi:hypothetical protein